MKGGGGDGGEDGDGDGDGVSCAVHHPEKNPCLEPGGYQSQQS